MAWTIHYPLVAAGLAVSFLGDFLATRRDLAVWVRQREREGEPWRERVEPWGELLFLGARVWFPLFGLILFVALVTETTDRVVAVGIPDPVAVVAYLAALWILFVGPGVFLDRLGKVATRRLVRALEPDLDRPARRFDPAGTVGTALVPIGSMAAGLGLVPLVGCLPVFGVGLGLVMLQLRSRHRRRQLALLGFRFGAGPESGAGIASRREA
jgi:hypothetical protein